MSYLKELRDRSHLSQKEAAKKIGFSYSYFAKVEGEFVTPSYSFLMAVKQLLCDKADMNKFFE